MGIAAALALCLATGAMAQAPAPPAPTPAPAPAPQPPKPGQPPAAGQKPVDAKPVPPVKPGTPKPYKDVVTADAKSDKGLFTVHRIDDKVLFEIPTAMYDRDMLWQTEIAQTGSGAGYGGTHVGEKVIRWSRRNNTVYLRSISYAMRGDGKTAIQKAVDDANVSPIILTFPVEAEGEHKSAVIDATRLYAGDAGPVPGSGAIGGAADPARSYLDRIKSFPTNIEANAVVTYNRGGAITTTVHHSMVLLPEKPMPGRYFDSRVGYFTEDFQDYGSNENRVKDREFIARYRLEKKDPSAKISDPVKPIVYYIGREVPEKWRPYLKQAVEAWNPCFEQAGFSHAIVAKDAPTEKEDPNWDPEDARYSVIRWAAQPVENAMGPHVSDPRSGEILSAHIIVWHDALKLAEQWYFSQVACMDKRAQVLPLPEPLMGELLRYIVTHEVGHTLGLRHNHKASSSYTAAQLRSAAFTEVNGDEASIMDYGRFNYVAQPGDNARLIPIIGPYDKFAIEWGYMPVQGATTPDAEKAALDEVAAREATNPTLRFGGEDANARVDPTVQMEDLGSDPIESTGYGLKNVERNAHLLMGATAKYGDDYSMLQEMYMQLLGQRMQELLHVVKLVGGVVQTDYHVGHGGEVYRPVPKEQQAKAVRFLVENAFSTPRSLMVPDILNRIEFGGVADRMLRSQNVILNGMLSESRIQRLVDREAAPGPPAYTVSQLVTDVQNGVWSELSAPAPRVDICRRNLQRAYLKDLQPRLVGETASQSEFRPVAIGALRSLQQRVTAAIPRTKDTATALHLRDCKAQIENILNPKVVASSGGGGQTFFFPFLHYEESLPEAQKPGYECHLTAAQDWLKAMLAGKVH
jgi:hypothetical protein